MVRSMYSGVAGMKAHQIRMDVIGNNIANVNTYGYKSSRATFRDMYYQNIRNATAGTDTRGGVNPSSVGYGSSISSVDIMMGTATMTSTGNPLDVAITGEGFLQVMDNDGNIFYTKAGMLDIDANGNLIDTNGYFVLGTSGNPRGKAPGSEKIQFNIPNVAPTLSYGETTINGTQFTIEASKYTTEGNVNFTFTADSTLPYGQDLVALLGAGGQITVKINPDAEFEGLGDLQTAVNRAITEANGGAAHPAGDFKFTTTDPAKFGSTGNPVTGAELVGANYGVNKGSVDVPTASPWTDVLGFVSVGDNFRPTVATASYKVTCDNPTTPTSITIEVTVDTKVYRCVITDPEKFASKKEVVLKASGGLDDSITLSVASWDKLAALHNETESGLAVTPSTDSSDVGLTNASIKLSGGTEGGAQTIKDLIGIAIGGDGVITATHGTLGDLVIGRIDLASFDSPRGLQQKGSSYFEKSANSGEASLCIPGEDGTGSLLGSTLELSNVDLSQEFSDMITTQRGFQANSRLITVSDTMLEELINLKR